MTISSAIYIDRCMTGIGIGRYMTGIGKSIGRYMAISSAIYIDRYMTGIGIGIGRYMTISSAIVNITSRCKFVHYFALLHYFWHDSVYR